MSYRFPPRFCVLCGADGHEGHKISYNGKCEDCAVRRQVEAIEQMAAKRGPLARKWMIQLAKAGERARLEEEAEEQAKAERWQRFLEQEKRRQGK